MVHTPTAERIIIGTLENVLDGGLHPEQAIRQLRAHAKYCRDAGDPATADVADGVARELEGGRGCHFELNLDAGSISFDGARVPDYGEENDPDSDTGFSDVSLEDDDAGEGSPGLDPGAAPSGGPEGEATTSSV